MMDKLVHLFFRWGNFRELIFQEVHMYDRIEKIAAEYEKEGPTNLTWAEGDKWYGWTYNKSKGRYYFDDIGNESLMGLWEDQWAREDNSSQPEYTLDEIY